MKNYRMFNMALIKAIAEGEMKPKTEYAQYLGQIKMLEAKYRERVESGLLPDKVRGSIYNGLEAIEREIMGIHEARAKSIESKIAQRKEDIAFERRNNPSGVMLRHEEARLNVAAMSQAERMALAMQYSGDTVGLSREMVLALAAVLPEGIEANSQLRSKIREQNLNDPVLGDPEIRTLETVLEEVKALGPSIEMERINASTGATESFYVPIGTLLDLESE